MFRQSKATTDNTSRHKDFSFLSKADIYMDTACQSLRPTPVQRKLQEYFSQYNACGGRVKYAWGNQVDEQIAKTRQSVLDLLHLPAKKYSVSFTLNTTYGINLLLQQLPSNEYKSIVTSEIEHNSVYLPTMTTSERLSIPRIVLKRRTDGTLLYEKSDLQKAIVVVNAVSNIDGRKLMNVQKLVADTHDSGGIVIIDAAQAMSHSYDILQEVQADAICFSSHKMYGPSLGVVVARRELIKNLQTNIIGGGMVTSVTSNNFVLADDEESLLEPGLQAFGEIVAFGETLKWLQTVRFDGQTPKDYVQSLADKLYQGLKNVSSIHIMNDAARPVISFHSDEHDAHRLAAFLSGAGIMVRSGYFCCHYYLQEVLQSPPLVRLSLGVHNTPADIDYVLDTLTKLHKKGK